MEGQNIFRPHDGTAPKVVHPAHLSPCRIAFPRRTPDMLPDLKDKLDRLGTRLDSLGRHL